MDANALDLGTVGMENLTVTTGGALTDSGAVTVALDWERSYRLDSSVTLGDSTTANFGSLDFSGAAVSITEAKRNGSGGLGSDRSAGTLVASGAVTQSGAGRGLDCERDRGSERNHFDERGNDFTGAVSLSNSGSNDVALTDANALDLGTVGVGQNLTVTTAVDATQ